MVNPSSATFRPLSLVSDQVSDCVASPDDEQLRFDAKLEFPSDEDWISVFVTPCTFAPSHFHHVMDNLLRNPNLTSSCLFRADVLYDSDRDPDADLLDRTTELTGLRKYMKAELRPRQGPSFDSYTKHRVVVRNLVPRNPALDKELVQTVCMLSKTQLHSDIASPTKDKLNSVVVYVPHADDPATIPYYHPKVRSLALLHTFDPGLHTGSLSVHYRMFPANMPLDDKSVPDEEFLKEPTFTKRLERTALNLLQIIHKHAHGQQAGYKKRVHHDVLIDQVSFQNLYVRLKQKYAKSLMETWAEVTDPQKHVFEDIGIAAFLIAIWRGMYGNSKRRDSPKSRNILTSDRNNDLKSFPGFVDIGCGNGVLVHILISEGYDGWGFDVRKRKSWSVFPEHVQDKLKELVLVPEVLQTVLEQREGLDFLKTAGIHNGVFPAGTFIISNHADQLTPWTPLLAYSSNSPFISIPCCSHALNGKLSRFYDKMPETQQSNSTGDLDDSQTNITAVHLTESAAIESSLPNGHAVNDKHTRPPRPIEADGPGPSSGNLALRDGTGTKTNMPSAYAGFTAYVMRIAAMLDYKVEREVLRIPSTRNLSIVTRHSPRPIEALQSQEECNTRLLDLLRQEIGDVSQAAKDWVEGAIALKRKAGGGH